VRALREFLLAPPVGGAAADGGARSHGTPFGGVARRAAGPGTRGRGGAAGLADLFVHRSEPGAADVDPDVTAMFAAEESVGALATLSAAEDARAVAVAAAGILARRARAACALACVWTAPEGHRHPEARPPAGRASRRLAAALCARGLDALPCGRAAVVALPPDPDEAVAAAGRATAAAGAAPAVLALGGPRAAAFDDLIAAQDRVLVVTRPDGAGAIGALAVAGLPTGGPPHETCAVALGTVARALAAGGLATPAALRRALDAREEGRG
jgi:hypothetical protein